MNVTRASPEGGSGWPAGSYLDPQPDHGELDSERRAAGNGNVGP
jgi:hypothetical protein